MRTLLCVVLLALSAAFGQFGRDPRRLEVVLAQGNATSAARLQLAAASLKPFNYDVVGIPLRCKGIDGELFPQPGNSGFGPVPQGRCTGTYVGVRDLMEMAFASPYRPFGILGLSSTFDNDDKAMYQFQAVAPDASRVTKAELQEMLQTLTHCRSLGKVALRV